jgi:hypothetical protein
VTSSGCITTTCTSSRGVLRRWRGTLMSMRARDEERMPQSCAGRAVAQRGARAGSEDRRHPPGLVPQSAVPNGIHAAVHPVKPTQRDAVLDRVRSEADVEKLRARQHSVLPAGDVGDRVVNRTRRTFGGYFAHNVRLVRHAPILATRASRITTQMQNLYSDFVAMSSKNRATSSACAGVTRLSPSIISSTSGAPVARSASRAPSMS